MVEDDRPKKMGSNVVSGLNAKKLVTGLLSILIVDRVSSDTKNYLTELSKIEGCSCIPPIS